MLIISFYPVISSNGLKIVTPFFCVKNLYTTPKHPFFKIDLHHYKKHKSFVGSVSFFKTQCLQPCVIRLNFLNSITPADCLIFITEGI